jgi:dTDP-4-dehydrorhamnose reductase
MKVLILGHNGLLGHMVKKYFDLKNIQTITTNYKWPDSSFKEKVKSIECDYIINCIGAIHQKTKIFDINWELPIWLDLNCKAKIIHPGTDCEMDNDEYGISKKAATNYLLSFGTQTKIIKTSIIGPELNSNYSLFSWLLTQQPKSEINGFGSCYWNGNTTLMWAQICEKIINNWENYPKQTIISSKCISKYDLLSLIKEIYNLDIKINISHNVVTNKCLVPTIKTPSIKNQLIELKTFYGS